MWHLNDLSPCVCIFRQLHATQNTHNNYIERNKIHFTFSHHAISFISYTRHQFQI